MEDTLVIIKPDATARNLVGDIIKRFEEDGFSVAKIKTATFDLATAKYFYTENRDKPGYLENARFMSSGLLVCIVFKRKDAVSRARELVGSWDPAKAERGTIRKDFGIPDERGILHIVHASSSPSAADREISFLFGLQLGQVYTSLK